MKLKLGLIGAGLLALSTNAFADAREALEQRLAQINTLQASFNQTVADENGETVHQASGTLAMARPDKLRWHTLQPDDTLLIAEGNAVWHFDSFVEQVTIIDQQQAIESNPIVLLTSTDPKQWQAFAVSQLDAAVLANTDEAFAVVPKEMGGQIQQLNLQFNQGQLVALSFHDAQGQISDVRLHDVAMNGDLQESLFTPVVPDSYAVDDQR